ncbi:PopC secretion inhibitor PopD [Stigmatella aurantiaca]|uniref:Conserved uncharacterized protein n=1 Tax=Stigmatella aurantiaca (strain DW4/3-1) TaxID=378806 RepID=E3FNK5_STIAD|nr:hypothetical protein [Stigmatella aurantiaca]ADO68084.1 conserved uncharacterized protein [Stigmatella aurantiaca DW4/3-1]
MSRKQNGSEKSLYALPRESLRVRTLPGHSSDEALASDWIDVTVMPAEDRIPPPPVSSRPRSRADVYRDGLAAHTQFRDSLMRWLEAHHLLGAVRAVSEPGGSLPMLTLRCAPRVLDQLRRAPEFEAGTAMSLELHS